MRKNTKILAALLALMMALALAACVGGETADDPNLGVYQLSSIMGISVEDLAEMMGEDVSTYIAGNTLELKSGGKAELALESEDGTEGGTLDYKLDGEDISLSDGSDTVTGTLKDGVITLEMDGVEMSFTKADAAAADTGTAEDTETTEETEEAA